MVRYMAGQPGLYHALTGSGQFNDDDGYGVNNYLTIGVNNGSGTWSGQISDQSNTIFVTKTGSGTEVFAGANVYHGTTTISGGVLELANANAVENSTVAVNVAGGLALATSSTYNVGGLSGSGNISLTAVDDSAATLSVGGNNQGTSYSGVLAGLGSLIKAGTGTLVLAGTDTYTGGTTVGGGTLQLGNASAPDRPAAPRRSPAAPPSTCTATASAWAALSRAGTIDNLTGSSTYTLTVGNGNASGTFSGTITDTTGMIALTKTGSGTLALLVRTPTAAGQPFLPGSSTSTTPPPWAPGLSPFPGARSATAAARRSCFPPTPPRTGTAISPSPVPTTSISAPAPSP